MKTEHEKIMHEQILIIEDNLMNMVLVTDLLKSAGYGVLQAEDAEAGIHLARTASPDLILMDLALPGMDGLCATRQLAQDPRTKRIPIVALTAHAMKGDEARVREAGCMGYISKPIDTRTFVETVAALLAEAKTLARTA